MSVEFLAPDSGRSPILGQDARLFLWNGVLFVLFNIHLHKYKEIFIGSLHYDLTLDMYYVHSPAMHLNIDHEPHSGVRHQKNCKLVFANAVIWYHCMIYDILKLVCI